VEYNLLMFLKVPWLLLSTLRNPFGSSYFFWMDGGYGKGLYFHGPDFRNSRWPDYDLVRRHVDLRQFFVLKAARGLCLASSSLSPPLPPC